MKIAIVGGGMAGLGAAYELAKDGNHAIRVFEKSRELGGLAHSIRVNGEPLEAFYHHMFPTYYDFFEIAEEIGVKADIFFKKAASGILYQGKSYPMNTPLDLLRFSPLSFAERICMGLVLARLKLKKNYKDFEKITAASWLKKYLGNHAYAVMWEPLLTSKFGRNAEAVGMTWFWSRIYERPTRFGYFRGGFKTLIDALGRHLRSKNVNVSLDCPIENITRRGAGFSLKMASGEEFFDHAIVAAPPAPFLAMTKVLLSDDFKERTKKLEYFGTICGILLLDRHLTDFYWLNINEKDYPFVAVIDHTHFVPHETYGGSFPVYIARYLDPQSDLYRLSDDEVWTRFIPLLKKINPLFSESWIKERHMSRAPFTQPVIPTEYSKIRPSYRTPVPGLWWVSMSHIYPWDRGTDHSFHAGRELAKKLLTNSIIR